MNWNRCKNILCIRADNMGDVIMTTPALRALKETFGCRITLLTSGMGSLITPFISEIDETIVFNVPWIKAKHALNADSCLELIEKLKTCHFDAAIIFTVYSQSALPSAMLTYMANIPLRLAYCRENPYALLTNWFPDKEPYSFIQHQVKRDLNLVKSIGATTNDERLSVSFNKQALIIAAEKLSAAGFDLNSEFIVVHPGVSEEKRKYPTDMWIKAINLIKKETDMQILLTGSKSENTLTETIQQGTGDKVFAVSDLLTLEESIAVIAHSCLVISVNTSTVHIAAAFRKPVVDLYAQTNPQHTPWLTKNITLFFSVPTKLKSKNEIIEFVNQSHYKHFIDYPSPAKVAEAVLKLLGKTIVSTQPIYSS